MKVRVLQRFEDSHPFIMDSPEGSKPGSQYPTAYGLITVKHKMSKGKSLCSHVATFPADAVLDESNCPDLETRVVDGTDRYPGWLEMKIVEVIE